MKLRIKGNSLRLRVAPSEMALLLATGRIEETIHFGLEADARLTYALEQSTSEPALTVRYQPQEVTVVVGEKQALQWAEQDQVGLYAEFAVGGQRLELAVEKDFACLDKGEEQNADTFPHPKEGAVC